MDIYTETEIEFLTDRATFFSGQRALYLEIKSAVTENLHIPKSMVRVCGSAYWGKSFASSAPFIAGTSDLDLALISDRLFTQLLSEVRLLTRNFTNLTHFSAPDAPGTFQDYAFKKGIIRLDISPQTATKFRLDTLSGSLSKKYRSYFKDISFRVYDTDISFSAKQYQALEKFGPLP